MEPVRLNKYLSDKGVCSRREADRLTELGVILVNGVPAEAGQRVTDEDEILVEGRPVETEAPEKVIIAVNKPVGVVCTTRNFKGEENIVEMVGRPERLYPVGRLDKDSEGLIFLTNDGAFMAELTKAAGHHEKEYEVTLNKEPTDEFIRRLEKGIFIQELQKTTAPCHISRAGEKKLNIILTQGMNRQIRRMCETCGYEVRALKRVRIMNVELGDLETGAYREITGEEKEILMQRVMKPEKIRNVQVSAGSRRTAGTGRTTGSGRSSGTGRTAGGGKTAGTGKSAGKSYGRSGSYGKTASKPSGTRNSASSGRGDEPFRKFMKKK